MRKRKTALETEEIRYREILRKAEQHKNRITGQIRTQEQKEAEQNKRKNTEKKQCLKAECPGNRDRIIKKLNILFVLSKRKKKNYRNSKDRNQRSKYRQWLNMKQEKINIFCWQSAGILAKVIKRGDAPCPGLSVLVLHLAPAVDLRRSLQYPRERN